MAIYVVSDLHGQYDLFQKGLERIDFSANDRLYIIGDAIDRGPDGLKILRTIMNTDNMDLLLGNHEFMMINHLWSGKDSTISDRNGRNWRFSNGGENTKKTYDKLPDVEKKEMKKWLKSRKLICCIKVGEERFCLTHSYFIPKYIDKTLEEISYNDANDIVWKSMFRYDECYCDDVYSDFTDLKFITGHVPVQRILPILNSLDSVQDQQGANTKNQISYVKYNNLIGIDGGCAYGKNNDFATGALFVRLDDMSCYPILCS